MQKITKAGRLTRIVTYSKPRRVKETKPRVEKATPTTAAQQRANDRRSMERLEDLLYTNFSASDLFVTLSYDDANLLHRWRYIQADVQNFIHRLRHHRQKRGDSLKYVYSIEGQHGNKRTHVHIVLNAAKGADALEELCAVWHGGNVDVKRLQDWNTLGALAAYMCKEGTGEATREMKGRNLWHPSRNLRKPTVKITGSDRVPFAPPAAVVLERESRMDFTGEKFSYLKYISAQTPDEG